RRRVTPLLIWLSNEVDVCNPDLWAWIVIEKLNHVRREPGVAGIIVQLDVEGEVPSPDDS
ncbi:MAG: hypothetical protein AB7T19_17875, partial [Planctomycetota bacterium]